MTEAAEPTRVVEALVTPLSTVATVIVATRPTAITVPRQRRASQPQQWAAAGETADLVSIAAALAAPDRVLDLDSPEQQMSGWRAIEEMLEDQLSYAAPDHDPAGAITALRQRPGDEGPPPFVLANLLVDYAREPAVGRTPTRGAIGGSLGAALDQLVARAYDDSKLRAAVALLNVLPYGLGAGLPEREWLTIANATRAPDTQQLDRDDVAATLAVDQTDSVLSSALRRDAALFYHELEEAEATDVGTAARRHAIVGARQPTSASASLSDGRYVFSELLGHRDLAGDGTVSAASGPKGIPLDDNSIRRIADKHGHLQCNNAALDEVESVVSSEPVIIKAGPTEDLSVTVPELLSVGEPFAATISSPARRRSVAITVRDEHGGVVEEVEKAMRHSTVEYRTAPLDPGGYSLEVRDVADVTSTSGVNSSFLVWPE